MGGWFCFCCSDKETHQPPQTRELSFHGSTAAAAPPPPADEIDNDEAASASASSSPEEAPPATLASFLEDNDDNREELVLVPQAPPLVSEDRHHWSTRDAPPSHFRLRIERFSRLASSAITRYESCEFRAGGCKWKLALYPNGNKPKAGTGHVSLYLVLIDKDIQNKEILATYTLFVFDHVRNKYLTVREELSKFHAAGLESGFDKFLPLQVLADPLNGYLVNDTCVFGAEVFLIKNEAKGQCATFFPPLPRSSSPFRHTWNVANFWDLGAEAYYSNIFTEGGHNWKMELHPRGQKMYKGSCLALYLVLADAAGFSPGRHVVAEFKLRVVDQSDGRHSEYKATAAFSSERSGWGKTGFLCLNQLNESTGYLVDETCVVQAEVTVLGSSDKWN